MVIENAEKTRVVRLLLKDIVQRLNRSYRPDKIILYGSYAYGNPTSDSDIDLLIIKDTDKRSVDRFIEVKQIIYQPGSGIPISPLVYTPQEIEERLKMGDDFVKEIMAGGTVLSDIHSCHSHGKCLNRDGAPYLSSPSSGQV